MVLTGLKVDIPLKLTNVSFENELPFHKDSIWISQAGVCYYFLLGVCMLIGGSLIICQVQISDSNCATQQRFNCWDAPLPSNSGK